MSRIVWCRCFARVWNPKCGNNHASCIVLLNSFLPVRSSLLPCMQAQPQIPEFKLILVGKVGVEKTTFIENLEAEKFPPMYVPPLDVEIHPVVFHTNRGPIKFNIWDSVGEYRDGYSFKLNVPSSCSMPPTETT